MKISLRDPLLAYTGAALDRAGILREDAPRIAALLREPSTRFIVVRDDRNFIASDALEGSAPAAVPLTLEVCEELAAACELPLFLGLDGDAALFALDPATLEAGALAERLPPGEFMQLRDAIARIAAPDAARAGYARALAYWHRTHRYCPNCGTVTRAGRSGHVRTCTNAACAREHYPHINPAVIMLVSTVDGDGVPRALLGRHRGLPPGMYSTLAGFIEPGESLEEAVAREVFEEAGVAVRDVRYFASQPWPFPAGVMLGFHAEAASDAISLNDRELDDARWFSADEIAGFDEWGSESTGRRVPRRDSIARALIDAWLATARRER